MSKHEKNHKNQTKNKKMLNIDIMMIFFMRKNHMSTHSEPKVTRFCKTLTPQRWNYSNFISDIALI